MGLIKFSDRGNDGSILEGQHFGNCEALGKNVLRGVLSLPRYKKNRWSCFS